MRITFILISLCFICQIGYSQSRFNAKLYSARDGKPILYAKVTTDRGDSRLSNSEGFVSIQCSEKEKLVITHISFDTLRLDYSSIKSSDTLRLYLRPRVYELQPFTFSAIGPRETFDNRFVKLDLGPSHEQQVKDRLKIEEMRKELGALDQASSQGMVLGSPITALYEQFSKTAKERQKYEELVRQDLLDSLNAKKFNNEVVAILTEMDLDEIEDFLIFCSFHQDFIAQATALELYIEILRCKQEYLEFREL